MTDPLVQVIDESNGEIVYTLRIKGTSFRPKVFRTGPYTLKVGEPGTERMQTLKNILSLPETESRTIEENGIAGVLACIIQSRTIEVVF